METITIETPRGAESSPREPTTFHMHNDAYWEMGDYSSGYDDAELSSPIQPAPGRRREYEDPTYTLPVDEAGKAYAQPPSPDNYHDDINDPSYYEALRGHQRSQMRAYTPPGDDDGEAEYALQALKDYPDRGLEFMFDAAMRGRTNVVRALIEAHVPPHPEPGCREEQECLVPIHTAAYKGHLECVQVLVEEGGVNPDDVSVGHTVLMRAVMSGNVDLVRWLLETRRVNPIRRLRLEEDHHSVGALEIAALEGKLGCAEVLVDCMRGRGASVSSLMTLVLMECAGMSGNEQLLERVLSWAGLPNLESLSLDPPQLNPNERAKLEAAIIGASKIGHAHTVKRILGTSSLVHAKISWSPLLSASLRDGMVAAAGQNDLEGFITFLDLALLKETNQDAFTNTLSKALYEAADRNARDMVVVLAEKYGVNVNDGSQNPHNLTPLIAAAGRGHLEVVQYLVDEAGADIMVGAGEENDTPLWFAVKGGHQDVALFLLRHGGPVNEIVLRRKPNFSHPDSIYMRVIRFLNAGHGVKIFLDRRAAREFQHDAERGSVNIEGLTSGDEEWWDRLNVIGNR